jgi:hypothetical protein
MGDDIVRQGRAGCPGSGGASPYPDKTAVAIPIPVPLVVPYSLGLIESFVIDLEKI